MQKFLDFTPISDNLFETIPAFGPEYYISFEVIVTAFPSSGDADVISFSGNQQVAEVKVKSNQDISVDSNADDIVTTTDFSGTALNTPVRVDILQTLVLNKVLSLFKHF